MEIKKAVFPVAGLGTRFLPATKVIPKEMLPVVDKPIIQYATEEAVNAGIMEIIFVVSPLKTCIQDHYSQATVLERELDIKDKPDLLEIINSVVPANIQCSYVNQAEALGLGHAVLCAQALVGNEPFAVILPDDMIDDNSSGCLKQMLDIYRNNPSSIIAVENIVPEDSEKYGIVSTISFGNSLHKINAIIEKPKPKDAPSSLAVVGRYVLPAKIFDILTALDVGKGGEIQLTDAIAKLIKSELVLAYEFKGTRFDCGSKIGLLKATVNYALKHSELKQEFAEYLTLLR